MPQPLVHSEGWIQALEFKDGEKHYRIVGTRSGDNAVGRYQKVWDAVDTVKNVETGTRRDFTRRELSERFKKVELIFKEDAKKRNRVHKGKVPQQ